MTSAILALCHGGRNATPSWRSIVLNNVPSSCSTLSSSSSRRNDKYPEATSALVVRRTMAFRPRRTPPPSVAGVSLRPRSDPLAPPPRPPTSSSPAPSSSDGGWPRRSLPPSRGGGGGGGPAERPLGGAGRAVGWISPHHKDHYGRIDSSTLDHPHLMHGDPHMPVGRYARGDGGVVLDPRGGRAVEYDDYRLSHRSAVGTPARHGDDDDEDIDEDVDGLEREYGSDAADAIRQHLSSFRARLESASPSGGGADGVRSYSPLDEVEERFRTIDRLTAAVGSTQDLALRRRARTESRDFFRSGLVVPGGRADDDGGLENDFGGDGSGGTTTGRDDVGIVGASARGANDGGKEFGHGRGYDAKSVFGKGASVTYAYGKDLPSPTYHPDFPTGSNVGNNPNDPDEEPWMHELNKLIYEERYTEMELGDIDETYTPVNVQKSDMDRYMKEKERTKKYNMLEREDEHEKDREEKPDEILEMIKNGEDPNQEAFGPWGECTIKVDRVQKPERGGTTVRYRALVIGGNGNGAAGFGIGKALSPNEAIVKACKHCKRNVFYVDRYLNSGLSYDLAGKHNSCRVRLRAALMTHESLEEIAMKRGKKLLNLQRARRLGI
ncbi:hypothetical protein ACHAW5_001693 [Stephanodiscus triporus]|uniref:S5 DRBM domain-containing protein n=1 Tax=Stephanodiscus triporus TaxID=2934178 RepID=A0ABD3Q8F7_9STRA